MKNPRTRTVTSFLLGALATVAFGTSASALPIVAEFIQSGDSYSFLREGATPTPVVPATEYFRFAAGASISLDLTDDILTLNGGPQDYLLTTDLGPNATFSITALMMDLGDTDGFLSGTMDFIVNGVVGTFDFANSNYGSSAFNSSVFDGSMFELYGWGGSDALDISINFGIAGTVVPVPATLFLVVLGVTGMIATRRRRA